MLYGIEVSKYIIHDNEFIGLANSIRLNYWKILNICKPKASSYNSNVYVDECAICKKKFTKSI